MANTLANLAREYCSTAGTGPLVLTGAVDSATLGKFNTFANAGITNGQVVTYAIEDANGHREVGQGTYSSAGPSLTRTTVYSSTNGGAKLDLSGSAQVFITSASADYDGRINVKSFGAKGDTVVNSSHAYVSGTDDSAALQAATDFAVAVGGRIYLPKGIYYQGTAGLTIDQSAPTDDSDPRRVCVEGDGQGVSTLLIGVAQPSITLTGGASGGLHAYVEFSKFRILGTETTSQHGIKLNTSAYVTCRNVTIFHCDYALYGIDTLSSEFHGCVLRNNNRGAVFSFNTGSRPNNLTFLQCEFGINKDCAGYFVQPALVRIIGGACEGNGTNSGASLRGGFFIEDAGVEGAVGLLCDGVYFEANQGTADIYVDQTTTTRCHHVIRACSFVRNDATNFVTNNIKFGCDSGTVMSAFVEGCAFKKLGTYTPDAARLYIDTASCAGSSWNVDIIGNSQESSLERATTGANLRGFAIANANTDITSIYLNNTGLKLKDTNASHGLIIAPGSDLTADRTLTLTTGDAARTLDISAGSVTISAAGAALIDDADAAAQRTTLGVTATGADTNYCYRSNNLSDVTAATARTNLGLGTAAVVATGTSGATIPLLNGVNTWTGAQTFNYQTHVFTWSDDGAATGPIFNFVRVSASPAVGDSIAGFNWVGYNSSAAQRGYGLIEGIIIDPTAGSEDGRLRIWTYQAGSQTVVAKLEQGMTLGSPTGADKGVGTLNATAVYDDNVLLTCMGGELFQSGKVTLKMWDDLVPDAEDPETRDEDTRTVTEGKKIKRKHKLAHEFDALLKTGFDPLNRKQWLKKFKDEAALPGLPNRSNWQHGSHSVGEMTNKQTLAMEMMAMQIASLHDDLEALKAKVK